MKSFIRCTPFVVLILPPDFPENKTDSSFLRGENEYTIGAAASCLLAAMAVDNLLNVQNLN